MWHRSSTSASYQKASYSHFHVSSYSHFHALSYSHYHVSSAYTLLLSCVSLIWSSQIVSPSVCYSMSSLHLPSLHGAFSMQSLNHRPSHSQGTVAKRNSNSPPSLPERLRRFLVLNSPPPPPHIHLSPREIHTYVCVPHIAEPLAIKTNPLGQYMSQLFV